MKFILLIFTTALLFVNTNAFEPPSRYRDISFGSDTLIIKKNFPASDNHKHTVVRQKSGVDGVSLYTIRFPKGQVDSTRLYFYKNKFSMAVEYWYPGRDMMEKALKTLTGKHGNFVRQGSSFLRRDGNYAVRISWSELDSQAIVTYLDVGNAEKIQQAISSSLPSKESIIDSTLGALEIELNKLDSTSSK